jgi:hypothetical protein
MFQQRTPLRTLGALALVATAVTLTSVAAAGPEAAKQRVGITMKDLPSGTFVLTPLQSGQTVGIYSNTWWLTGKRGKLTIREGIEYARFEGWVDVGNDDGVAIGTWRVVRVPRATETRMATSPHCR